MAFCTLGKRPWSFSEILASKTIQYPTPRIDGAYQAGQPTGWPVPDGLEVGFGLTPWKKTEFWGSPAGFGGRIRSGIVYLGCFAGTRLEKEEGFEARLRTIKGDKWGRMVLYE